MTNTSIIGRRHDSNITLLTVQSGKVEFDLIYDLSGYHYSGGKKPYAFFSQAVENARRCKAACKVIR